MGARSHLSGSNDMRRRSSVVAVLAALAILTVAGCQPKYGAWNWSSLGDGSLFGPGSTVRELDPGFLSLSVGTSMGTIAAITPIALGVADASGLDRALVVGAVIGGATFGDNLSLISDTAIAAARTQGCTVREKFRENVRIVDYRDFGYRRIRVQRPLRLTVQVNEGTLTALATSKPFAKLEEAEQAEQVQPGGGGDDVVDGVERDRAGRVVGADQPDVRGGVVDVGDDVLEDELFGHVPGAYTGADKLRKGVFEFANGGTLFLDEIGDMPMALQAKLLRVLEDQKVYRIGSNEPIQVNVRVLSATHKDLEKAVAAAMARRAAAA